MQFSRTTSAGLASAPEAPVRFQPRDWTASLIVEVIVLGSLFVLAVLAVRNVRMRRGDRKGGFRLALAVLIAKTAYISLQRHWVPAPLQTTIVIMASMGVPLFAGVQAWLCDIGLEPFVRRRWP